MLIIHTHTHTFTYTQVQIAERDGEALGAAQALVITECKRSAAADAREGDVGGGGDKRMVSMLATHTHIHVYFLVHINTFNPICRPWAICAVKTEVHHHLGAQSRLIYIVKQRE
jgi:hypothetical protein